MLIHKLLREGINSAGSAAQQVDEGPSYDRINYNTGVSVINVFQLLGPSPDCVLENRGARSRSLGSDEKEGS